MRSCDVLVLPYRDTQGPSDYPLAMMEMMACGKPVVGTKVGGIPELLSDGDAGLLVETEDPDSVASAVVSILSDPTYGKRMGSAGREVITRRYSLGAIYQLHASVYRQLLAEKEKQ
jgi:glycosyltransferase involved in cell wall biosynthesis